MKKYLFFFTAMFLGSCAGKQFVNKETAGASKVMVQYTDARLESAVKVILVDELQKIAGTMGSVYVVETKTGRIKTNVSLRLTGNRYIPAEDDFRNEQMLIETGSAYLALLSTGKVTSETVFDTGFGVYKDVKDHNWRRGGYGAISLERALEVQSQVAFTMAKERVYGANSNAFNCEMDGYFNGMNNQPMGLLTFYNAVANDGCMVLPMTEGNDVVVINEQIAPAEHIKTLQEGLRKSVSQGLMRKCGRDDVSASGRTFIKEGETRRMELCGYFPSQNPQYTMMVVLEKEGLPASAGVMCGGVFARVVDYIVDNE